MPKTALELPPESWRSFRPDRRRAPLHPEERRTLEARFARAWRVARDAARLLREQFGAEKVWAFGSLVYAELFDRWSDIDLAAEGIPPQEFYRAVAAVSGLSGDFEIDLVDPATCPPALRMRIERDGLDVSAPPVVAVEHASPG